VAPTTNGQSSCLLYLVDVVSGSRFLVDSGAAYSVIPFSSKAPPTGPPLRGAGRELLAGAVAAARCTPAAAVLMLIF
jgi:hypothetical protein